MILPTSDFLSKRGMQVEDLSPLCKNHSEVVERLFWHCAMSTEYLTVLNTKGLDNTQIKNIPFSFMEISSSAVTVKM